VVPGQRCGNHGRGRGGCLGHLQEKSQLGSGPRDDGATQRLLETLTPLRQIKNRLGVIAVLAQCPEVVLPADLRAWLDVRSARVWEAR